MLRRWIIISLSLLSFLGGACQRREAATEQARLNDQPTETATISLTSPSPPPTPTTAITAAALTTLLPTFSPTAAILLAPTSSATAGATFTPTALPTEALNCSVLPSGSFLTIWRSDPNLTASLGCPASHHPQVDPVAWDVQTSYQPFERGLMLWSNQLGWYPQPVIYVLLADLTYRRFDDTFDPGVDPLSGNATPPPGLFEPAAGFGKVWREQADVREALGWATAGEVSGIGKFQLFAQGDMIWIEPTGQTYVFSKGVVHIFDIPFTGE